MTDTTTDMINHPPHYQDDSGVECIEVTQWMPFCTGNCFKYLYRAGKKGSAFDDLKKAKWYAERAEKRQETWSSDLPPYFYDNINAIAQSRKGNIRYAMEGMVAKHWHYVIACINTELSHCEVA